MALTVGSRLGPYEIVAPLGSGGPAFARACILLSFGASTEAKERTGQ